MDWPVYEYDWLAGLATHLDENGQVEQRDLNRFHVFGQRQPCRQAGQHHLRPDLVGGDQRGGSPQEFRGMVAATVRLRHAGNARCRRRNVP